MAKIIPLTFLLLTLQGPAVFAETPALIPSFQVEVILTEKAAAKLKETSDMLEVDAYFLGDPLAGDKTPVDDDGQIELGDDSKTISQPGIVKFPETEFDGNLLDHLIDHTAHVLINVNSTKFDTNTLDCDVFEDKVSVAVANMPKLNCKLVGE